MEYVCMECGGRFEHPMIVREYHAPIDQGWWEEVRCSPCCLQPYGVVGICPVCGETVEREVAAGLCLVCAQEAERSLRVFLRENYTEEEQRALDFLTEGISFTELGK